MSDAERRIGLGTLLTVLGVAMLIIAGARERTRLERASAAAAGHSIERGAGIYRDSCGGCHGISGGGVDDVAPPLNTRAFFTTRLAEANYPGTLASYIEGTVTAGRTVGNPKYTVVMPSFGDAYAGPLRSDQIRDVVRFVLDWEAPALGRVTASTPPRVATSGGASSAAAVEAGRTVYGRLACVGCHGWPGGGGVTAPDLDGLATVAASRMPGLTAEQYVRLAILGPSAHVAPGCPTGPCPDMMPRSYGDALGQVELDSLVRYLLALER